MYELDVKYDHRTKPGGFKITKTAFDPNENENRRMIWLVDNESDVDRWADTLCPARIKKMIKAGLIDRNNHSVELEGFVFGLLIETIEGE